MRIECGFEKKNRKSVPVRKNFHALGFDGGALRMLGRWPELFEKSDQLVVQRFVTSRGLSTHNVRLHVKVGARRACRQKLGIVSNLNIKLLM